MRAEKLGIALQRFRKYSSSFHAGTAGFVAENRRRFSPFSAVVEGRASEDVFVRRISGGVSAGAVELRISGGGRSVSATSAPWSPTTVDGVAVAIDDVAGPSEMAMSSSSEGDVLIDESDVPIERWRCPHRRRRCPHRRR